MPLSHIRTMPQAELLLECLLKYTPIGIAVATLDGRALRVNPALCRMLGLRDAKLLERRLPDLVHADDRREADAHVALLVGDNLDAYQLTQRWVHRMGFVIWLDVTVNRLRDPATGADVLLYQLRDVTARREQQDKLDAALAKLSVLEGIVPICCCCGRIRHDDDYWQNLDSFLTEHAATEFSHGLCPTCYDGQLQDIADATADATVALPPPEPPTPAPAACRIRLASQRLPRPRRWGADNDAEGGGT